MNPQANPIVRTYHRLDWRAGGFTSALSTAILGGTAVYYQLAAKQMGGLEDARPYYLWALIIQTAALSLGWLAKVSAAIGAERKEGILETNRLTPMPPDRLCLGYLLGPPGNIFYAYAVSVPFSFALSINAGFSFGFWLLTQSLVLATGFMGAIATLVGGAAAKTGGGGGLAVVLGIMAGAFFAAGPDALPNFMLPSYWAANLLGDVLQRPLPVQPSLYGLEVPVSLLTVATMSCLAGFCWLVARRKFQEPGQVHLNGWQATAFFAILLLAQHGLIWHHAQGAWSGDNGSYLLSVHIATLAFGFVLLYMRLDNWHELLVEMQYGRPIGFTAIWKHSGLWLALRLALVAVVAISTQCYRSPEGTTGTIASLAVAHLFIAWAIYCVVNDLALRWFSTRVPAVILILLLYGGPFLTLFYFHQPMIHYSPLATGCILLASPDNPEVMRDVQQAMLAHAVLLALLAVPWVMGSLRTSRSATAYV